MSIIPTKVYKIVHPRTGAVEQWEGRRILAYQQIYGHTVELAATKTPPPKKVELVKPAEDKPKRARRSRKTKDK